MNETVVSFCGCLKSSIIYIKLNILYFWKIFDEIINNSRANAIFISTRLFNTFENPNERKYQIN